MRHTQSQIELKGLNGAMDTDSPNESIGLKSVKRARNIQYRGMEGNLRVENIKGTTLIPENLPAGTNTNNGAWYDNLKNRIFYFNHNSNLNHGIYIIDVGTVTSSPLLVNGTNTLGNILDFNLNEPIFAVRMLYGDATQGDTLYFNDSSKVPCQVNIERTLAATFGVMKRSFLEVIKYPANRPPYVTYRDNSATTVNTLRKKLFKFKIRYVYYSREKSVTSIQSEVPLPINAQDTAIDKDPTKNCEIAIVYETGDANVQKIEIIGYVTGLSDANGIIDPNAFSDAFLIQTIDKAASSLANNDIATFIFKNDQAYIEIDPEESIQLQDLVPLEANSLEMLNGNVPIYGGITSGFDRIAITGSTTSSSIPQVDTQLPYIFVGSQSGDSAFGAGNIHIIVLGTIASGYTFTFITTNKTVTFVSVGTTTAAIIAGLAAAAIVQGFTVVSSDTENLVVTQTGESLQMVARQSGILTPTNEFAYNWNDKHNYCLNYFDAAGRTIGAQTNLQLPFSTVNYTETAGVPNIPQLTVSISNRPPLEAVYFSFGRTRSLAFLKFLYWVSDSTYKDTDYAYIGIENLNTFIANNPTSKHLAYDFSAGDRIRFVKLLSGTPTVYVNNDFEILGQTLSPIINGTKRTGQFLKIALPATSGSFDFGTSAFANYQVQLYTPAQSVANGLNEYLEFGERFTIGNPGTATRYHQGMTQNQTPNLSQPATFTFNKGDVYYRPRTINVGAEYNYNFPAYEQGTGRTTLALNFVSQSYVDANITPGSSLNANLVGFNIATNTDRAILNVTTGTYTFRMKGAIIVSFNDFGENFAYYLEDSSGNVINLVPMQPITQGPHTFPIDVTFQMLPNTRMFIFGYSQGDFRNSKTYSEVDFKITRELPFSVSVMDANYSDYFPSKVNSNGRPTVEQPDAARVYNPVLLRWGLPNILETNINQVSRFTVLNFDEIDATKGDIDYLLVRGRQLEVLQQRGCGWFGIYAKVIQDNNGKNVLVTTDAIINKNNVNYLAGNYGIAGQKWSVTATKTGYAFIDPILGYEVRRAPDGLIALNELYHGQYEIRNKLTPYANGYVRANGALSKIIGYYDYYEEQYVTILQGGTFNGNEIFNDVLSFNEKRNAYCCFYDFGKAEWGLCAQDKTFLWKDGKSYIQNNDTKYCNFFDEQYYPSVTFVFNDKIATSKTFEALAYEANQYWLAQNNGQVVTSQPNPQTNKAQISSIRKWNFEVNEGRYNSYLNRDANSMQDEREALVNGDYLKGVWIQITLTYGGSDFAFLYAPYIKYEKSNLTI